MRHGEPDLPGSELDASTTEETLRKENQALKRQIEQLKGTSHGGPSVKIWNPSNATIWSIVFLTAVLLVVAFLAGYIPLQKRRALIVAEAQQQGEALPRVEVVEVGRSSRSSEMELPGNIQAITEAPILARADGYLQRRMADIGDRVHSGQPLAEIEAPELDAQVQQAKANLQQAQAALDEALANYGQGKSTAELARVTAERWGRLVARGVVSKQENDQYQAQYQAQAANLQALEKAIAAQRSTVSAAEANLARLEKLQSYLVVKAPFDGVITLRNVDAGVLVNAGNTLLFRIAQTATLRTYVNVPQANAGSIRPGQTAHLSVSNLPGREFTGAVARTANALDPNSRTLLVEVHVPNADGALLPGMYARVDLSSTRTNPPTLIPSEALIVRADGARVAMVRSDHTVHLQPIQIGRDYGDRIEVSGGLKEGDIIIPNPGDAAREGLKIDPVSLAEKATPHPAGSGAGK
ncbi:MAG: efflux RND transporter periplasmic adaptor subunit [Acidobacteriia bacterium]|nr:efflux RND transporter periplasmic adaptor subunit [Terriglobia bacterium]